MVEALEVEEVVALVSVVEKPGCILKEVPFETCDKREPLVEQKRWLSSLQIPEST